jgi:hypothetical protein
MRFCLVPQRGEIGERVFCFCAAWWNGRTTILPLTVVRRTVFEAFNLAVKEQAFVTTYHHPW